MARDPRIVRPCRFCGEGEHLGITGGGFERPMVFEHVTIERPNGQELMEYVDGVCCLVCEAMAPLDTWNGTRPEADYVALRNFEADTFRAISLGQKAAA